MGHRPGVAGGGRGLGRWRHGELRSCTRKGGAADEAGHQGTTAHRTRSCLRRSARSGGASCATSLCAQRLLVGSPSQFFCGELSHLQNHGAFTPVMGFCIWPTLRADDQRGVRSAGRCALELPARLETARVAGWSLACALGSPVAAGAGSSSCRLGVLGFLLPLVGGGVVRCRSWFPAARRRGGCS